jgi:hypothetical protein
LGHELYPAVSLYDVGDRVRIREVEGANLNKGGMFLTVNFISHNFSKKQKHMTKVMTTTTTFRHNEQLFSVGTMIQRIEG